VRPLYYIVSNDVRDRKPGIARLDNYLVLLFAALLVDHYL
jgi:hypothetical protein